MRAAVDMAVSVLRRHARAVVLASMLAAALLQALTYALADGGGSRRFLLGLVAAGWAPHALIGVAALLGRWCVWFVPAMIVMLLADVAAFLSVFVWSTDAQAPLILLFMPLWNLIIVAPAALLLTAFGWWIARRARPA
jgi:hypothetical protein